MILQCFFSIFLTSKHRIIRRGYVSQCEFIYARGRIYVCRYQCEHKCLCMNIFAFVCLYVCINFCMCLPIYVRVSLFSVYKYNDVCKHLYLCKEGISIYLRLYCHKIFVEYLNISLKP